jgi:hypothetical protein
MGGQRRTSILDMCSMIRAVAASHCCQLRRGGQRVRSHCHPRAALTPSARSSWYSPAIALTRWASGGAPGVIYPPNRAIPSFQREKFFADGRYRSSRPGERPSVLSRVLHSDMNNHCEFDRLVLSFRRQFVTVPVKSSLYSDFGGALNVNPVQ